ncbi:MULTISPECIES: type II toxin-antitoxin system HipA family toxin [unclassified Rhizobium]|uniref:type II toxin-antitoxin system HipA family toxin n=1 Tax=unclassified Rhizobium TaxID=2613769 RepID=UPI001AD979AF|nr:MULTISPECIES: type II toxin-antitoxin system HipA family toxin [unclassified Rhizobium]MBO9172260.1 type II toxin-antitoxin system HipA family toxin [Rhizobium sp. L245/93]QXZ80409.1 type II toxin-antitoxin system HipA family toxin [Rhizobium sp. L51/94]
MGDFRGNSLAVWYLENPLDPRLVGQVKLEASNRRCLLELDDEWRRSGFPLSPDLTLDKKVHAPLKDMVAPGAIEDAMPDRWGERMIRVVSRPSRMSPLDKLWYAGDRRFGALGMSSSFDEYRPVNEQPLMSVDSLQEAEALFARVLEREPLTERERQLIASAGSMGGAHPKMLIEDDAGEWIAKFPRGSNVDQLLVEHACMELGRRAGLHVASSRVIPGGIDHILMVRRFDRVDDQRVHAVSARTLLSPEADDSYATIAAIIRRHGVPDRIHCMQRELFRRMAFNIMIDNTDDHTKNHAFLHAEDGWLLSLAFDIPTQMNGLGQQAIQISSSPKFRNDFSIAHAVAAAPHFGMSKEDARHEWNQMAGWIGRWRDIFSECGVTEGDIDYLGDILDSPAILEHRREAIEPSNIGSSDDPDDGCRP